MNDDRLIQLHISKVILVAELIAAEDAHDEIAMHLIIPPLAKVLEAIKGIEAE